MGQGHYGKVKSRSHHDVAHLHHLTNVPIKCQLPTPYGFWDIAQTRFHRSRSLWQGQRSNQGQTKTLHTYTPLTNVPTKDQLPTPYGFWDIAQTRFSNSRSLRQGSTVKSSSDHVDVAHLHLLTNVPTKYQLPTPYGFWDTAGTNFFPPATRPYGHHGWKQYPDSR